MPNDTNGHDTPPMPDMDGDAPLVANLDAMNVGELRDRLRELGHAAGQRNKAELIEAIEAAERGEEPPAKGSNGNGRKPFEQSRPSINMSAARTPADDSDDDFSDAVRIEITPQDYEVDDRDWWWIGLHEDCPIDHASVAGVTFSIENAIGVERRGTVTAMFTAGCLCRLSRQHVALIKEQMSRAGVRVHHRDGHIIRAKRVRLRPGDEPLARWAFMKPAREGMAIPKGTPLPPRMLANAHEHANAR